MTLIVGVQIDVIESMTGHVVVRVTGQESFQAVATRAFRSPTGRAICWPRQWSASRRRSRTRQSNRRGLLSGSIRSKKGAVLCH